MGQDPPEEFQYNQSGQLAFYFFIDVMIGDSLVDANDWVGVFRDMDGDGYLNILDVVTLVNWIVYGML